MKKNIFLLPLLLALFSACAAGRKSIDHDPYFESFFEKTRLIMTKEEVQIYKHLPDLKSKDEFIDEFWKKRDPYPETPENENKIEFERRIDYANRWFRENRPAGRGWDSARGRIFLQLGEPDNRYLVDNTSTGRIKGYERWVYYQYQLELIFIDRDGFGEYKLSNWPVELLTAIEMNQFMPDLTDRKAIDKALSFTVKYKDGQILIEIPMKKVHFKEMENMISAEFEIAVFVYKEHQKIDAPVFQKEISFEKDKIPDGKVVTLSLPYPLTEKAKYYFDVIVKDKTTSARSRNFLTYKN